MSCPIAWFRRPRSSSSPTSAELAARRARQLPKVLLHEHLDGGLRVATLLDLLRQRGIASLRPPDAGTAWPPGSTPAPTPARWWNTCAASISPSRPWPRPRRLARVAREAAEDARGRRLRAGRVPHRAAAVRGPSACRAPWRSRRCCDGLSQCPLPAGPAGLIVCAMRHEERCARSPGPPIWPSHCAPASTPRTGQRPGGGLRPGRARGRLAGQPARGAAARGCAPPAWA